jgi:hypothetical protein
MKLQGIISVLLLMAIAGVFGAKMNVKCMRYKRVLNEEFISLRDFENKEYIRQSKDEKEIIETNYIVKKSLSNLYVRLLK